MTEAVHGACRSLTRPCIPVEAACLPHNIASRGVLEKSASAMRSAKRYLKIDGQWRDHLLYALLREEFYPALD